MHNWRHTGASKLRSCQLLRGTNKTKLSQKPAPALGGGTVPVDVALVHIYSLVRILTFRPFTRTHLLDHLHRQEPADSSKTRATIPTEFSVMSSKVTHTTLLEAALTLILSWTDLPGKSEHRLDQAMRSVPERLATSFEHKRRTGEIPKHR